MHLLLSPTFPALVADEFAPERESAGALHPRKEYRAEGAHGREYAAALCQRWQALVLERQRQRRLNEVHCGRASAGCIQRREIGREGQRGRGEGKEGVLDVIR